MVELVQWDGVTFDRLVRLKWRGGRKMLREGRRGIRRLFVSESLLFNVERNEEGTVGWRITSEEG